MDQYENQSLEDYTSYARRNLLDLLEASYGDTPSWPLIRARVLQIFGRSGFGRFSTNQNREKNNGKIRCKPNQFN